jgi:gliding motility-associated-like protein
MKKIIGIFTLILIAKLAFAQEPPKNKLKAHYTFNFPDITFDSSDGNKKAQTSPIPPDTICGVDGNAIAFRGDQYMLLYDLSYDFSSANFTVAFYFKPNGSTGVRDILTNVDSCSNKRALRIQYDASSRTIKVRMKDEKRGIEMVAKTETGTCWQHVVFVRESNYHRLYINGVRKVAAYSPDNQRIVLTSNSIFTLAKSGCDPNISNAHLKGFIDDFRYYNAAIRDDEAVALYNKPDRIKNQDVLLFIGQSIDVKTENTCATKFLWSPATGVADVEAAATTIKPTKPGNYVYTARMNDKFSTCSAYDTLKIRVIDPTAQPCGEVFVPNAFTPNGDDLNETFGLSNPYTIGTLEAFEIVDRWGGVIFTTNDPFQRWDGKFNGSTVQPGTYLYRMRYICQGEEKSKFGSFVVMQ